MRVGPALKFVSFSHSRLSSSYRIYHYTDFFSTLGLERKGQRGAGGWWVVGGGGLAPWILSCFCKKNIFFPYTLLCSFGPRAVNSTLWFSGPHTVHCAKSLFFLPLLQWTEPARIHYERVGVGVGEGQQNFVQPQNTSCLVLCLQVPANQCRSLQQSSGRVQ